ncbi:M23 family metallopeptidase [Luteimonas sp. SJ-92]|uniref:M23 family metallopeptidase n=1 Tax=Luteimonas salinisoli TaxID=2752307 RepID=A0A853JI88_9GAMM|nr:M23 family metallopeptidase [Luteimonas salinisoli]NZA28299.1 M23 family metallopeptidase [Luteimonas salinisoli]
MRARTIMALAVAALLAAPAGSQATRVYRWTSEDGVVHYGDRIGEGAPAAGVTMVAVEVEPAPVARLRLEQRDGLLLAWADNLLDGPIEVMLHASGPAVPMAQPALPARATVPARGRVLVARIQGDARGGAELRLEAVPGHPGARPLDVEYAWPLQSRQLYVEQGWGGRFSHSDAENRHAVDFAIEVGTPVLAARDGTVMQVESGFTDTGTDERYGGRANFVRVLHDDGTMAVYAHLDADRVFVRSGERVRRGQRIALSGNTGFSSGPHLHFVVQVNRGMRLQSIPFRMFGPRGILRFQEPRQATPSRFEDPSPSPRGCVNESPCLADGPWKSAFGLLRGAGAAPGVLLRPSVRPSMAGLRAAAHPCAALRKTPARLPLERWSASEGWAAGDSKANDRCGARAGNMRIADHG